MKTETVHPEAWQTLLDALEHIAHQCQLTEYDTQFASFRQRLLDKEFRLAVVGQFSSGKSTFINALVGKDILSHTLSETTATITRIVNVGKNDPRARTGLITFRNEMPKKVLRDFSELRTYTTKQSEQYEVAQDIESVELYVPFLSDDTPIVIVDTPGLNGTSELEIQTYELVREAHACIYLFQSRGIAEKDVEYIQDLKHYQSSFIFVQSFLDAIRREEGETPESRVADLKNGLQEYIFPNDGDAYAWSVCGVSALRELAGRDGSVRRLYQDDEHDLTDAERKQLCATSHFDDFRSILSERFSGENLENIKYRDTAVAIRGLACELRARISSRLVRKEQIWAASSEAQTVEQLNWREENLKRSQKDQELALCGLISRVCDDMQQENKSHLHAWAESFLAMQSGKLDEKNTQEEIEQYARDLPRAVAREIHQWSGILSDYMEGKFQELHQLILENIERYTTQNLKDLDEGSVMQMKRIELSSQPIEQDSSSLTRKRGQQREMEAQLGKEARILQKAKKDAEGFLKDVQDMERAIQQVERASQQRLSQMGSRPSAKTRRIAKESSGFFGGLKDFFFGKKYREVPDDSLGQEWDNERRHIQSEASEKIEKLRREKIRLERKLREAQSDITLGESAISALREDKEQIERSIAQEQQQRRIAFQAARREFLNVYRKRVREHLRKYFEGDAESDGQLAFMMDHLRKAVDEEKAYQQKKAVELYRKSLDDELQDIRSDRGALQKEIEAIREQKATLEELLAKMEETA